jgi:hypothetical protein
MSTVSHGRPWQHGGVRVMSLNVNGIRAAERKGL